MQPLDNKHTTCGRDLPKEASPHFLRVARRWEDRKIGVRTEDTRPWKMLGPNAQTSWSKKLWLPGTTTSLPGSAGGGGPPPRSERVQNLHREFKGSSEAFHGWGGDGRPV